MGRGLYDRRNPAGPLPTSLRPALDALIDAEPLDAAVDMPEGLSFDVWDRLVEARNAKIASLKSKSDKLANLR